MAIVRKSQAALFLGLITVTLLLTMATRFAVAQCGSGVINSCKWSLGTPCSQFASINCGQIGGGNPCPNNGKLTAYYYKPFSLNTGNWYICTNPGGGPSACVEALTACMTINMYQTITYGNPSMPGTCTNYCGQAIYQSCSANASGRRSASDR